jgi:hypothetical protein
MIDSSIQSFSKQTKLKMNFFCLVSFLLIS